MSEYARILILICLQATRCNSVHDRWYNVRRSSDCSRPEPGTRYRTCIFNDISQRYAHPTVIRDTYPSGWDMCAQLIQVHCVAFSLCCFAHDGKSFLEMISSAASTFPSSIYSPPPDTAPSAPALNLQLGSLNVNLGGPTPGVYRTTGEGGAAVQADGLRDGMRNLIGKVKLGVDRIGLQ